MDKCSSNPKSHPGNAYESNAWKLSVLGLQSVQRLHPNKGCLATAREPPAVTTLAQSRQVSFRDPYSFKRKDFKTKASISPWFVPHSLKCYLPFWKLYWHSKMTRKWIPVNRAVMIHVIFKEYKHRSPENVTTPFCFVTLWSYCRWKQ